jgi:hypothetical protein
VAKSKVKAKAPVWSSNRERFAAQLESVLERLADSSPAHLTPGDRVEPVEPAVLAQARQHAEEDAASAIACALRYYKLVFEAGVDMPRMYYGDPSQEENAHLERLLAEQAEQDGLTIHHWR